MSKRIEDLILAGILKHEAHARHERARLSFRGKIRIVERVPEGLASFVARRRGKAAEWRAGNGKSPAPSGSGPDFGWTGAPRDGPPTTASRDDPQRSASPILGSPNRLFQEGAGDSIQSLGGDRGGSPFVMSKAATAWMRALAHTVAGSPAMLGGWWGVRPGVTTKPDRA